MKKFAMLWAALAAGSISAACAPAEGAASPPKASRYQAYLTRCHEAHVCNGVYLVARSGKVVFTGTVGDAGDAARTPLSRDSAFDIGSISKQITAVAILKLAEQGKLSIDERVSVYLPQFPYADVTVAQLMSHTSGIPDVLADYGARAQAVGDASPSTVDGSDILPFLTELKGPAVAKPGERWAYNNTGYLVLATLVEAISGESFADHLQSTFFSPLGMAHTRLRSAVNEPTILDRAWGFKPSPAKRRSYDQIPGVYLRGAGGLYSTAGDLLLWQRALNAGLVRADLWARATAPAPLLDGTRTPYGFGLSLKPDPDGKARVSHGGHWRGFKSDLSYFPDEDLIVIQLTNNGEDDSVDENVAALRQIAEGRSPASVLRRGEWDLAERVKTEQPQRTRAWFQAELAKTRRDYAFDEKALNALGYGYLGHHDARRASTVFELAALAFPRSPNSWDSLADAYEALGRRSSAAEALKVAASLDPASSAYRDRLRKLTNE